MNKIQVNRHSFNAALEKIKKLSEQVPPVVSISKFEINGGLFGLFEHSVTGAEVNNLAKEIQSHLISNNKTVIAIFKEINEIYNALVLLDRDYIQSIVFAVKAAEKASEEAKIAAEQAEKNTIDIKRTIEVLKQFKTDIERLKHLINIDQLWDDGMVMQTEIDQLKQFRFKLEKLNRLMDVDQIWIDGKVMRGELDQLIQFRSQLDAISHLMDVDQIWNDGKVMRGELDQLIQFRSQLDAISHLMDVDQIWNDGKVMRGELDQLTQFRSQLDAISHLMDIDQIWNDGKVVRGDVEKNTASIFLLNNRYNELLLEGKIQTDILKKKLVNSYIISGLSLGIAIVGFTLNVLGVL